MMTFFDASLIARIVLAIFATLSSSFAICVSVDALKKHRDRKYLLISLAASVISTTLFLGISDVFTSTDAVAPHSLLARMVGRMPYDVIILLLFACDAATVVLLRMGRIMRVDRITPWAIKEAFDILPDGICFATEDGLPLLVNVQMNRLCALLMGESLTNAKRFWNDLYTEQFRNTAEYKSISPSPVLGLPDGTVWDFQRHIVKVDGKNVCELLAFDVTAQYRLNQELKERNERLSAVGERLRRFNGEVERLTREKEILSARIKVHDDVGRLLLSLRAYLEKPENERDRKALLPLWKYTVSVLRRKEDAVNSFDYENILSDAKAIGVSVTRSGDRTDIPDDPKLRNILLTALRECVSNTVKHAHGDKLNFSLSSSGELLTAEFTNSGEQPTGKIIETGGLRNLRSTVESVEGKMMITTNPRFILRLELPNESDDKENLYV